MPDPLAAFESAPRVAPVDGEIVIIGDGVCASYTPEAALVLAQRLLEAVEQGGRRPGASLH